MDGVIDVCCKQYFFDDIRCLQSSEVVAQTDKLRPQLWSLVQAAAGSLEQQEPVTGCL
jgi:hypothetical protein